MSKQNPKTLHEAIKWRLIENAALATADAKKQLDEALGDIVRAITEDAKWKSADDNGAIWRAANNEAALAGFSSFRQVVETARRDFFSRYGALLTHVEAAAFLEKHIAATEALPEHSARRGKPPSPPPPTLRVI